MKALQIIEAFVGGYENHEQSGIITLSNDYAEDIHRAFGEVVFNTAAMLPGVYLWVWKTNRDLPFSGEWNYCSHDGLKTGETIYLYRIENV